MPSKYIKLHLVSSKPGNQVLEAYFKADSILSVYKTSEEYAKIGAASAVDNTIGTVYVVEDVEEVRNILEEALRDI